MSVSIEPLFDLQSVRAFRWTATAAHTAMKESYAIGRVERGAGCFVVGGRSMDATRRSLHVRQPGDVHRDVGRDGPITLTVVAFAPQLVDAAIGPVRITPTLAPRDPRGAPLHRLLDAAMAGVTGLAREVAITEALATLSALDGPSTHTRAVRRALAYLRDRAAETITLDELAAHASIDKFRLCRAFRAEVGLPPHAWLTAHRVVRAKELLAEGIAPSDVALLVGFYDQSRLNQHFRRIVGTSPGRWAREQRSRSYAPARTARVPVP